MMKRVVSHGPGGAGAGGGAGGGAGPGPRFPCASVSAAGSGSAPCITGSDPAPGCIYLSLRRLICHSLAGNRRILEFIVFKEPRIDNRDILWLPVIKNLFCKRVTNRTKCSLADVGF